MKRTEQVVIILIVLLILLKLSARIAGVDFMLFMLLTFLFIFYYALGFFLMNNLELKSIFRKPSYNNLSAMRILGTVGAATSLPVLPIAILYILMRYVGAVNMLVIALVGAAIVLVVSLIKYQARKDKFYLNMISRFSLWSIMAIIVYLIYP